jgi:hypothetical protein
LKSAGKVPEAPKPKTLTISIISGTTPFFLPFLLISFSNELLTTCLINSNWEQKFEFFTAKLNSLKLALLALFGNFEAKLTHNGSKEENSFYEHDIELNYVTFKGSA